MTVAYIYRPQRKDIVVCIAEHLDQMRPTSMYQHGFRNSRNIMTREANAEDILTFSGPRVSWLNYRQWSNLVSDEIRISGEDFAAKLKDAVICLIPEYISELDFPEQPV